MTHRWIANSAELREYVGRLMSETRYALDTEFHRERTYFPRLALVQLAGADDLALVDPQACDLSSLRRLFESDTLRSEEHTSELQ